jgi:DNA-binding SARP family transcriptional activator
MLLIRLFGSPELRLNTTSLHIPRRRSRALCYYLAAHNGPINREQLLNLLWPDHERTAAQQILRTTLHGIRRAGVELFATDQGLALPADARVDVRDLQQAMPHSATDFEALASALVNYRGPFLADWSLPDCPSFDDWAANQREHYQALALRGLNTLAAYYEASEQFDLARDALARALQIDPLREDVQRGAMRLAYRTGDRAGAIRRFEQLRELLDHELGVPPMAETQALYDAIVTDSVGEPLRGWNGEPVSATRITGSPPQRLTPAATQPFPPSGELPFTGRVAERERLHAALSEGQLALIEGEAGIGKSRLAEQLLHERGGLALVGAARELEQALPYQPLIEALRRLISRADWPALWAELKLPPIWVGELARLLPELAPEAPPGGSTDESRLWEAINRLLSSLARQQPVTLLIDDLQWAGGATLGLLGYLVRQERDLPLGVVATARHAAPRSPLAALLQALLREQRLERVMLGRLNAAETLTLAQALSPSYAQPLAAWLQRSAEGNPYMLAELVRHARDEKLLLADGTLNLHALSENPIVPQSIYSLIQARLNSLSPPARQFLDTAVAVGRSFSFALVARAASLSESAALDALDELRAARIILPLDQVQYQFDHSLTMEVAYREVGEPRHRVMHRRVAEALEIAYAHALDSVAGLLASHFAEGSAPERAASYALRAGQQALRLAAWEEAVGFFEQALASTNNEGRYGILMGLAEAHQQAGRSAQAGEHFRSAIGLAPTRADADRARIGLASALLPQARFAEMLALAQQVYEGGDEQTQVQGLFLWGTTLSLEGSDLNGAAERLQQAEAILNQQTEPDCMARVQVSFELGNLAAQQGDLVQAVGRYRTTLAIAEALSQENTFQWRILAHNNLGYHLHLMGALEEAAQHAKAGLLLAEERGFMGLLPFVYSTTGEIALARGEHSEAERSFRQGLDIAERLQLPERMAGLTANLGLVAARQGNNALAVHQLSTALAHADDLGTRHLAAQIRIWLAPLLPPAAARSLLAEARAIAEAGGRKRLLEEIAFVELKTEN